MNTIETKFSVGDVVYAADTETTQKQRDCPDCLGSRKWSVQSPAGGKFETPCPRCSTRYQSNNDLSLQYTAHIPSVRRLTIGSVRTNSHNTENPVTYMCEETGVGGGIVWSEDRFFGTEEQARDRSQEMANTSNAGTDWIVKQYNKVLTLSDYQIESAAIKASEIRDDERRKKVGGLLFDLEDCETMADVRKAIKDFEASA